MANRSGVSIPCKGVGKESLDASRASAWLQISCSKETPERRHIAKTCGNSLNSEFDCPWWHTIPRSVAATLSRQASDLGMSLPAVALPCCELPKGVDVCVFRSVLQRWIRRARGLQIATDCFKWAAAGTGPTQNHGVSGCGRSVS